MLIKWWKNKDCIKLLIGLLMLMGICFITAYFISNLYGLVLVIIELYIGTRLLKRYFDNIVDCIIDYLNKQHEKTKLGNSSQTNIT